MISVIIPTLNEEKALPETLDHLFAQKGDFEVILVDGGSTDKTLNIAAADKRISLIHSDSGRARQMNAGAAKAQGEWLLFLHADTHLPANAINKINNIEDSSPILAGGFRHKFSGNNRGLKLVSWLHNFRCNITRVFYGDQALFVKRHLFAYIDGFPDEPVLEDVLFGEILLKYTTPVIIPDHVITDSRKFEQSGILLSMFRVIAILVCHELGLSVPRKFFAAIR